MKNIKGYVIAELIKKLFVFDKRRRDTKLIVEQLGFTKRKMTIDEDSESVKSESPDKESLTLIGQQVFVRLAEFLFEQKLTLMTIIHNKIFDKVIDGKEYQLVKYRHFYQLLENHGFTITNKEQKAVENVITPFLDKTMEVSWVLTLLK